MSRHPPARERHAQKEGELINDTSLRYYSPDRPARSVPPPTRALCAPAQTHRTPFLQTSGIVPLGRRFEGRGPEARQRPCKNSAHEGHRSGGFGIPSGARKPIGRTQLWGAGTHPPRLSARRHTTNTTHERRRTTTKRCCVPTRAQSRRRRSMGQAENLVVAPATGPRCARGPLPFPSHASVA